jgi:hypothetical protein
MSELSPTQEVQITCNIIHENERQFEEDDFLFACRNGLVETVLDNLSKNGKRLVYL